MNGPATGTGPDRQQARSDRRGRVATVGLWLVRAVLLLVVVVFVMSLFADRVALSPGNVGRADVATPYLERVADAVAADRVFVDPVLASTPAAETVADGRILDGRPDDVHVVVMPITSLDGSTGRLDLTGRRLQHLAGQDGLYVVVDQRGTCTGLRFTGDTEAQETCDGTFSAAELDRLVVESRPVDRWYDPISAGVFAALVGVGICMLLGWLLRGLALLRERGIAYLPGLTGGSRRRRR